MRVVVVGGGIVGLCCAWWLVKDGHEVTHVDDRPTGSPSTSTGNAGMIVPSHFVPIANTSTVRLGLKWLLRRDSPFGLRPGPGSAAWVAQFLAAAARGSSHETRAALLRLNLRSRTLLGDLEGEVGEFGLVRRGLLAVCESEAAWRAEHAAVEEAADLGAAAEAFPASRLPAAEPGTRVVAHGAVLFPDDAHLSPDRLVERLSAALVNQGVWRITGQAHGWDGAALQTDGGGLEADCFVLAAGFRTPRLASGLGHRLPVLPGKGYSATVEGIAGLPERCALLVDGRAAVTPMSGRLRLAGTMLLGDGTEGVDAKRWAAVVRAFAKVYPDIGAGRFAGAEVWVGHRPVSSDGLPIVGRLPKAPHVVVATGHGTMGLSMSAVTGETVAGLLAGREPDGAGVMDPARFG